MSLDVYLEDNYCPHCERADVVYSANITHNLSTMADMVPLYMHLWRPDEIGVTIAQQLIQPLRAGLGRLKENPEIFKKYDSPNGWGTYKNFVPWVEKYLRACEEYPNARVRVCR